MQDNLISVVRQDGLLNLKQYRANNKGKKKTKEKIFVVERARPLKKGIDNAVTEKKVDERKR